MLAGPESVPAAVLGCQLSDRVPSLHRDGGGLALGAGTLQGAKQAESSRSR